jgi:hypothetical protein
MQHAEHGAQSREHGANPDALRHALCAMLYCVSGSVLISRKKETSECEVSQREDSDRAFAGVGVASSLLH